MAPIRRSWNATAAYLAGALGVPAVFIGVALVTPIFVGIFLLIVGGIVVLGLVYLAIAASGSARCPACAVELGQLELWGRVAPRACRCGEYLEGERGELRVVPDERMVARPLFEASLPGTPAWPDCCCVCGGEATRTIDVRYADREYTFSAAVPHCAAHDDGAELVFTRLEDDVYYRVQFRSRAYHREFLRLNVGQKL